MSFLDYVPGVSNVRGIINKDPGQAIGGPAYVAGKQVVHAAGQAMSPVDSGQTDEDRQRSIDAYNQLMAERAGAGPVTTSQVTAGQVAGQSVAAPTIDDAQAQQIRGQQTGYLESLQQAANGGAPSAAEAAYQRQQQQIAAEQMGLAGQARGTAGIAARRAAILGIGNQQQQAAADMGLQRAQEQAVARGQLGGALSGVRGSDEAMAIERARQGLQAGTTTAELQQRASEQNAANALAASRANAENTLTGAGLGINERLGLGNQALTAQGQAQTSTGQALTNAQANRNRQVQMFGAGLQAVSSGGAAMAASDERVKTGIHRDSDAAVDEFTRALAAHVDEHGYEYQAGEGTPGEHHGPMAQELEKSQIGRSLVHEDGRGVKMVDTAGLTMALAGVVARLARQQKGKRRG